MDMKPEYNHGLIKKEYTLTLSTSDFGENPLGVRAVLAKYFKRYADWSDEAFLSDLKVHRYDCHLSERYTGENIELAQEIHYALKKAGASPLFKDVSRYHLFPETVQKQLSRDPFPFHSRNLTNMGEYALDLWAKENNISIAYRYYRKTALFLNSDKIIRVWFDGESPKLIAKSFGSMFELNSAKNKVVASKWTAFRDYMEQTFWTTTSWYSMPENMAVADGIICWVEGYHQGRYKVLYDNPLPYGTANYVFKRFESLITVEE